MKNPQFQIFKRLKTDFTYYAAKCLKIVDKETGQIMPFRLNRAQTYIHSKIEEQKKKTGKVRAVIVKGRQQGCSTLVEGRYFWISTLNPGSTVFVLAHMADSTNHLFGMAKRYYELAPPPILPTIDKMNERRLEFNSINSSYAVGTAGSAQIGRGTTVRYFHGCLSEDSLVVLSDGRSVPISHIEIGDKVITASGATAPVSAKSFTGEKEVFGVSTWMTNETIKASKDHKFLTHRGLLPLSKLTADDYIQLPTIPLSEKTKTKTFKLNILKRKQNGGPQPRESARIDLDYDSGYFFGYYLAEGHVKKQWKYDRYSSVSFSYHEDETFEENIRAFGDQFATSVSVRHIPLQHKKVTTFYGTFLAELTNAWFGRVDSKGIPEWVFDAPKDFIHGLLDGYFAGDGSKTDVGRVRAPSVHERISRQLKRLILATTSGIPGIHYYERERYGVKNKPVWMVAVNGRAYDELWGTPKNKYRNERFKIRGGKRFVKIRDIKPVGKRKTWDIEVDHPDHNFETPIGIVSNSEVAYWENSSDIAAGVLQAVPSAAGTEIILESTANGAGNWFHAKAMEGLNPDSDGDFITIFTPWFWQPEYYKTPPKDFALTEEELDLRHMFGLTDGQLYWRRGVILDAFSGDTWRFKREYPNTVEEGFIASGEALIHTSYIIDARKSQIHDPFAPVVGGCDPARTKDRTVMILRRGREIISCRKYTTMDEMTCAGIIANEIDKYNVSKYFVDVGCGYGTVDRLRELGYGRVVTGVHFGATALEPDIYANKSAEMADAVRRWFEDGSCNIPDDDAFQADLAAIPPLRERGSRGKLALPPKDDIKQLLGGKSPDIFDALKLTFAFPVAPAIKNQGIKRAPLDTRRPGSPLSTVRDFNRTPSERGPKTYTSEFKIK